MTGRTRKALGLLVASLLLPAGGVRADEPRVEPTPILTVEPAATPAPTATPTKRPAAGLKDVAVSGGSLADVVRRSQIEKEKQPKKKSLGVITNEQPDRAAPKEGVKTVRVGKATPGPSPTSAAPLRIPEVKDNKGRTEADWRRLAGEARSRIAKAEDRVKKLDAEVRRLESDFYAWSDGNYRDRTIKPAWDQAREELVKARHEAEDARQALADLEDEARKSAAPPGWLRE